MDGQMDMKNIWMVGWIEKTHEKIDGYKNI